MGFAKEIEDFLNGYKAVSDTVGDAEDRKIRKEAAKRASDKDEQADMEDLAVDNETFLPPSQLAAAKRAPKKAPVTGAIPTTPELYSPYGDDPGGDDTYSMAAGGIVPDEQKKKRMAIPVGGPMKPKPAPASAGNPAGNQQRSLLDESKAEAPAPYTGSVGPGLKEIFASADKAVKAAFDGFKADSTQKRGAIGAEPEVDFKTNKGAATPEEIKAIDAKIDPNGEMDPWSKGRARLGYAYDYFIQRGEPEKAANVSKRILLFDKMASEARGKIAVQMINSGDADKGASVLVDAYNDNIHDGSVLKVTPSGGGQYSFSVTKDGKVVNEGTGNASQLAELAGNVANGSEFVRRTARVAAGDAGGDPGADPGATTPPGTAAANPPAIPTGPQDPAAAAAPATPIAPGGAAPADPAATPEAAGGAKPKGPRNIAWAKKQYVYAASVMKSWEDEVQKNPTPENKARLKDAQIRLGEAEQDAINIRMSTATKNADKGNIAVQFDKTLGEWRDAADPLEALPAAPKDGLRGQPKPQAVDPAAAPASSAAAAPTGKPAGAASYLGYKSGGSSWDAGDGQLVSGPQPGALKPIPPEIVAQAKAALSAGKSRAGVVRMLLENGYNPMGL